MNLTSNTAFVKTIRKLCRMCYTCVRECPVKAIRITDGQAEVMGERCIACGNCVKVCSQKAKQFIKTIDDVEYTLNTVEKVAACIAPSFPAEFPDIEPEILVGMVRALGFEYVCEVAFGADLVAREYRRLLSKHSFKQYIATTCPAICEFVESYHPDIVDQLAPIVSPMIATTRALRKLHGKELGVVFIGPCIAKKGEAVTPELKGEINAVITFIELREMLRTRQITPASITPSNFDPPHGGLGSLFSISRGLLQAANIREDLVNDEVVAAGGVKKFVDAIKEFEAGEMEARLLETLCCEGCIMGQGMSSTESLFARRAKISEYVRHRIKDLNVNEWEMYMAQMITLNLTRHYEPNDQRLPTIDDDKIREVLEKIGKVTIEDELNCGACGYMTCREHAIAILEGLAESEMCLPYSIEELKKSNQELAVTNVQLANTQEALLQSEKMATMGQLAAGIAHEVNNPLGVVLMYAHMLKEECEKDSDLDKDLLMIVEQADRCKKIVAGLLNFARQNKVTHNLTDLPELLEHTVKLVPIPEGVNININIKDEMTDRMCEVDSDQIIQVFTNLIGNAYHAMPFGGALTINCKDDLEKVLIEISDTGFGIPKENLTKIFEPFFTTKQIGLGTGLGLAVTYGIIKMHRGDIKVNSNADPNVAPTGTTFTVTLPRHKRSE